MLKAPQNAAGVTLPGSMLILVVLTASVALLTRQNLIGVRLRAGIENRMLASITADSVLSAIATMPDSDLCASVRGSNRNNTHSKSESTFSWLGDWEVSERVRNIQLRFQAYQTTPQPTPSADTYTAVDYPTTCASPSYFSGYHQKIRVEIEYNRSGGGAWQELAVEKWIPAP